MQKQPTNTGRDVRFHSLLKSKLDSQAGRYWETGIGIYTLAQCAHVHGQLLSPVQLFVTPWTGAHQAPLSMEFSRPDYWNGLPFSPPGHLSDTGNKAMSPASPT